MSGIPLTGVEFDSCGIPLKLSVLARVEFHVPKRSRHQENSHWRPLSLLLSLSCLDCLLRASFTPLGIIVYTTMSGNDEENLFVAPRRPARRTNRACRHSALTIVLAKNAEAILKLAGMFLCQYQASLLMTCSVLVALILSSRNNAPHIVLQRLRILLTATIALCAHSLHSTRSLLRTARELLFVRRNERQRQDNDPERKRTIDSLTDLEAYTWTRFSKNELFLLLLYLRIPETVSRRT
jgi:hypothetical protein